MLGVGGMPENFSDQVRGGVVVPVNDLARMFGDGCDGVGGAVVPTMVSFSIDTVALLGGGVLGLRPLCWLAFCAWPFA